MNDALRLLSDHDAEGHTEGGEGAPSWCPGKHILIGQVSACFGKRRHPLPDFLELFQAKLPPKGLPCNDASVFSGPLGGLGEHGIQLAVQSDCQA